MRSMLQILSIYLYISLRPSVRLAWTGLWCVVWPPLPALHPPVVHAVVVDGVSEGHLLDHGCDTDTDNGMTNLIKQQTILTGLQAHGPILTLVESVAGVWVSINL